MSTRNIASIRRDYTLKKLDEQEIDRDPFVQFGLWFDEVLNAKVLEPNAMILATSTREGKPSARVVLLKQFDNRGFSFFTNYHSRKALELEKNPYASLVFFWPELERQVRIEGYVSRVSETESDNYFDSRPEGSKIAALVSPQSQVIPNRNHIESLQVDYHHKFSEKPINRPSNWGGYLLRPSLFEFWQGRTNRLHDRIQYRFVNGEWIIERLAP
ncbi:MAG: pyridoxamine 5'-phosphate oxidase [Bacteroidales bacterium]|nr:pyridoxamine 5'-phosphate oxidase [Bacteroidales bacterium]